MRTALVLGFLVVAVPAAGQGQDLAVIASTPADGDSAVALQTTVRFTFSAPLDTAARFSTDLPVEFFTISPRAAVQIESVYVSDDLTQLAFDVTHTTGTDFVWIMTGARDQSENRLCPFYVLNYTTAETRGPHTVRGSVYRAYAVKRGGCNMEYFVAGLMNGSPLEGGEIVAAASNIPDQHEYVIRGVREGTYWPVALDDVDQDGIVEPMWRYLGMSEATFWDEAQDGGGPDTLVVEGGQAGVDMLIYVNTATEPPPAPAAAALEPNRPNPFRTQTTFTFRLERPAHVTLSVYDLLGRRVAVLAEGLHLQGTHEVTWAPRGLPGSLYLGQLRGETFVLPPGGARPVGTARRLFGGIGRA